jgi:hypothetical protein
MNANHVGALYPDQFGSFALGTAVGVPVSASGNAVATIPMTGTSYIIRRIVVCNANKDISTASVTIDQTNDGSNAVSNATTLTNVTSTTTYADVGLVTAAASTVYSAGALFVKVGGTPVSGGTCDIQVYGDIVTL